MNFDEMIKYVIWVVFLAIALSAIYFLLKKLGVM